ncbi:MAG: four helix bundle protein [Candidatus Peribacteraceae bacterium]|nr:four helix bundle protein [Candidatus Peribacteraceae bacterium]
MIEMPFEKLKIWQKAVELVDFVYRVTRQFPKEESFGLVAQMRRAVVSIPSNIAEGSQRSTPKEFAHFILIAKGSLAELRTEMLVSKNQKLLSMEVWSAFCMQADELDKMLRAFYLVLLKKKNAR